jgi:hypothetical protein
MKTVTGAVLGLVVSVIAGLIGYIYRDAFDAPRLKITHASIEAPSKSVALDHSVFDVLKIDGNISSFLEERVDWDAGSAIEQNNYTYEQIGDFRELLPAIATKFSKMKEELSKRLETFIAARQELKTLHKKAGSATRAAELLLQKYPELSTRLAAARNYYISVWKVDLFDEYGRNPEQALDRLIADVQGDLTQVTETLQCALAAGPALEAAWGSGEPAKLPIVGDQVPTMVVTIVVSNTGRTNGLLHQTGAVRLGSTSSSLILYDQKAQRRKRMQAFEKVEAGDTVTLRFALNTERNSRSDEKTIYKALIEKRGDFEITLTDIAGNPLKYRIESL